MTGKSTLYRSSLILIAAITASILLALSWPRLQASLRFLPVDTALSNYRETLEINAAQIKGLIGRATEAKAIHDHYRYWDGLSELQILRSQYMGQSFWKRRQALEDSISAAEETVRRAPAKPRTWLRIARAREALARPPEQLLPPLKMSILTGRVEPKLMLPRLELGLRILNQMDMDTRHLLRDQAVLTWAIQKKAMLRRIESGDLGLDLLRRVLNDSDQFIVSEIEAYLEK